MDASRTYVRTMTIESLSSRLLGLLETPFVDFIATGVVEV